MTLRLNGTSSGFTEIDAPAAAGSNKITLPTSNGSAEQFLKNSGTAGELEFSSMVETSTGVGIGTSSPAAKLQVKVGTDQNFSVTSTNSLTQLQAINDAGNAFEPLDIAGSYIKLSPGSSEAARLDSSGRLLVGTSSNISSDSFDSKIQTAGTNQEGASISIRRDQNSSSGPALAFSKTRSTSIGGNTIVQSNDLLGQLVFYGADGTDVDSHAGLIRCRVDGTPGSNDMPGRLEFHTTADSASSATQRFWIDSTGAIHTDNSAYAFLRSDSTSVASLTLRKDASGADGVDYLQCRNTANTLKLVIEGDGDVANANNSYGSTSDSKLKENIVDASSQWSDIKNLQVRNYNFTEASGYPTHTQIGLIAQEVETVSPGLVNNKPDVDEDGNDLGTVTKSVRYSVLYMKAVKALQEAQTRIETLETQNTAQQTQIDDLLARVTALEAA